jgi:hypothetical protein
MKLMELRTGKEADMVCMMVLSWDTSCKTLRKPMNAFGRIASEITKG